MQEATLGQTLEAVNKLEDQLIGHGEGVAGAFDDHGKRMESLMKQLDGMPDHDALMKGVHGLLGEHLGDHSGKVMDEINKLPLPPDEKILLQSIENMEESLLSTLLEAIKNIQMNV